MTDTPFRISYKLRALCILIIVPAMCFFGRKYNLDDALIYARYIQHALQGRGLMFNPGEPVNALTSILHTWLVLGLSTLLHGHVLLAQLLLSGLFLILANLIAESIVPLSGIFLSVCTMFYFCNGLETSLFLFLLVLCVNVYLAGHINWLPILCCLTLLARFEGGAMCLVIAWSLWRSRRFPKLYAYLPCIALLAFYLYFNLHYYHAWLPQSTTAKFGQGMSGFWGKWPTAFLNMPDSVYLPMAGSWIFAPVLALAAWYGMKFPEMRQRNTIVVPFLLILAAFYILFNIPGYTWYYAPFLYFLGIYAVRLIPHTRAGYSGALFLAFCLFEIGVVRVHRIAIQPNDYASMATWISHNTPANARIATSETGTIGWYAPDRYILDMVGLTTPENARYTARADFKSWLHERPDYVIVHHDKPFPWEAVAVNSPDYEPVPIHYGDVYLLQRKPSAP